MPKINFECDDYTEMIDWENFYITEPPYTQSMSHDEIQIYMFAESAIEDIEVPCHIQATERHIQIVTDASKLVGPSRREGVVHSILESRSKRPKTNTKSDFK